MNILSLLTLAGGSGGGGTGRSQLVGYVTKGSTFPTRRLDGSALEPEDYVKVDGTTPAEDFPFTIGNVTFTNRKDMGIYLGSNRWTLDAGLIQDTSETPTTNRDAESLNGNGTTQAQVNLQVANAIGKKKTISVEDKTNIIDALNYVWEELVKLKSLTFEFKGYVSVSQPTSAKKGDLWYQNATLPTTFPVNVKTYDGTNWSSTTSEYNPNILDLWSLASDGKGYYWFANSWNRLDEIVAVDDVILAFNDNGELTLKTKTSNDENKTWVLNDGGEWALRHIKEWKDVVTFTGIIPNNYTLYILTQDMIESEVIVKKRGLYKWDSTNQYTCLYTYDDVDNETIGKNSDGKIELKTKTSADKDKVWKVKSDGTWDLVNIKEHKVVDTFATETPNDYTLYILTTDITIAGVNYKKGFYTWDSTNGYVLRSGASEVFTDIDSEHSLPTTAINTQTLYRKQIIEYLHNNNVLANTPQGYKILDTENIIVVEGGISFDGGETSIAWSSVTKATIDELVASEKLELSNYETANFFGYGVNNSLFDNKDKFTKNEIYRLYFNPTGEENGYILLNSEETKWGDITGSLANQTDLIDYLLATFYTKNEMDLKLELKQDTLTEGESIEISQSNVVSVKDVKYDSNVINKPKLDSIEIKGDKTHEDYKLVSEDDIIQKTEPFTPKDDGIQLVYGKGSVDHPTQVSEINDSPEMKYSEVHTSSNNYINTELDNLKKNLADYIGYFNTKQDLLDYTGTLSNNDYAIVGADETHSGECWRYIYNADDGVWEEQYKINNTPMTQAQLDATNSGITSAKVTKYDGYDSENWAVSKLASKCEKGIQVSDNKLGHTNNITSPTAKRIIQGTYDAQGHLIAVETEFNWSNTYNTSAENQLFTRKGANNLYKECKNDWNYVGILSSSHGSTLNVKDDWKELLIVMRVSEGSSYYNLTNVIPKYGFTQGSPNGNQTFAGFFWNESFNAKVRLGLEGSGDNRNLKLNYSNAVGWGINGLYIYKR